MWECRCSCGNEALVLAIHLRKGITRSCGCLHIENAHAQTNRRTHNMTKTPEYMAWRSMKERCYKATHPYYHLYGGRGITVCDRWLASFENFYADMGPRPARMTLERLDNNEGYSPENCKWDSWTRQARNRRSTRWIEFRGERRVITEWSMSLGGKPNLVNARLRAGWSLERALTTPVNRP